MGILSLIDMAALSTIVIHVVVVDDGIIVTIAIVALLVFVLAMPTLFLLFLFSGCGCYVCSACLHLLIISFMLFLHVVLCLFCGLRLVILVCVMLLFNARFGRPVLLVLLVMHVLVVLLALGLLFTIPG